MVFTKFTISSIDAAIILIYLVGIVAMGCLAGSRQRRAAEGQRYFLAGRTLTWPVIGLALAVVGYGIVYLGCVWILKGFTKEEKEKG